MARSKIPKARFNEAYRDTVLKASFYEEPEYYRIYRDRYRNTLEYVLRILPAASPAKILEVGGGQIALLCRHLFGDDCTVGDVSSRHAAAIREAGLDHVECDLLHGDIPRQDYYDVLILCEVVEHLPVPMHGIISKAMKWVRPGGMVFITTPNLHRFRNGIRLLLGMPIFCNFFIPDPGQGIGHFLEYSAEHLQWQMERAGLTDVHVERVQLTNAGMSAMARLARMLLLPLSLRPVWRENLVAWGRRPLQEG